MKILLSYPRSGNHLVRFLIEILTEQPTLGCIKNIYDKPIFENTFPEKIPFNIDASLKYNDDNLFRKYHQIPRQTPTELICIVRNPKEVLLRNLNYQYRTDGWDGYDLYFECIDYFNNFNGKKQMFFYEDICTNQIQFVEELYTFLNINNEFKKEYMIQNIYKLYEISKKGENRIWGGVNSNSIHYYYDKINKNNKKHFDNYIKCKIDTNIYNVIREKYNL
jgi:hypothetical protein